MLIYFKQELKEPRRDITLKDYGPARPHLKTPVQAINIHFVIVYNKHFIQHKIHVDFVSASCL